MLDALRQMLHVIRSRCLKVACGHFGYAFSHTCHQLRVNQSAPSLSSQAPFMLATLSLRSVCSASPVSGILWQSNSRL